MQWDKELLPHQLFNIYQEYAGSRYFFMTKEKDEWLLGLGAEKLINVNHRSPSYVNQVFLKMLSTCTVTGITPNLIRLFGGFQFDEGTNEDFAGFGHSHFIWPKIQVLFKSGCYYLSFTNMDEDEIAAFLAKLDDSVPAAELPEVIDQRNVDAELFLANVSQAVDAMAAGQLTKVVLSRRKKVRLAAAIDNSALIRRGFHDQEFSYFVLLENNDRTYVSKTPEQLVKVTAQKLSTNAIAGTMSSRLENAESLLLQDEKNLKEHQIVVSSIEEDLEPYSSELNIPAAPGILANRYFYHLYTPITGTIDESDVLTLTQAMHPTPALGGFPKAAAAAFIQQAEGNRGFYGAPLGYIDANMDGEFIVAIRSMVLHGDEAVLYAGCGIVQDSRPEEELHETEIKFKPMLQLLGVSV
ncbi:isochorismate synthase [Macrococcus equipercicus]|uniref:isochorismate synthase n=1 Tax=Macrococcus equipercicus TaxID=69967 RepID=UPI0014795C34|nr:isochorismate synthase [Macrococcus equipercicus]